MRSYKANLGPPVVDPRVGDPDMGAILTIKGLVRGGTFWLLFLAVEKK